MNKKDKRIGRTHEQMMNERDLVIDPNSKDGDYNDLGLLLQQEKGKYHMDKDRLIIELGSSLLAKLFFSDINIKKIQNALRYKVFNELDIKISEQCPIELMIIMRSVYFTYAKELERDYPLQIQELNERTVIETYPKLRSNIIQYYQYIAKANSTLQIMDREKNVSNKGTKILRTSSVLGFPEDN